MDGPVAQLFVVIFGTCAWLTHVFVCFTTGNWLLLVIGHLIFPIGLLHGVGHWLWIW